MKHRLESVVIACVIFMPVQLAAAQTSPRAPECGCSCDALIDAAGQLNHAHCDAPRVKTILGRYAEGTARLLPEKVEPADIETSRRKIEQQKREAIQALLELMTREDLDRFLPWLMPGPGQGDTRPGTWPGGPLDDCDKAVYWINQALFKLADFDAQSVQFAFELSQYDPQDPQTSALYCNPALLLNSSYYQGSSAAADEARGWIQFAADSMTNGAPHAAALGSWLGWWRSGWAGFGFIVAWNYPPIENDARCTEVSDLALLLIPVAQAAHQGHIWALECAGSGGFFF